MAGQSQPLGTRIQVVGPSCSGKTTLAIELARRLDLEFIELDALFWRPRWQSPTDHEFQAVLQTAFAGERWVAAGNYQRHTIPYFWDRLDTVVWLDFPNRIVIPRVLRRSWRRWRAKETLWGTNQERFWSQLKVWNERDSLISYTLRRGRLQRRRFEAVQANPAYAHLNWVRLTSPSEVERWLDSLG